MPNRAIAEMLAKRLREGIVHPGDPKRDVPPTPIMLPFNSTAGMPKEMAQLMDGTVKLLSEAIVNEIETTGDSEIVSHEEMRTLKAAEHVDGQPIPVLCRQCNDLDNPLFYAPMTGGFIKVQPNALANINHKCKTKP